MDVLAEVKKKCAVLGKKLWTTDLHMASDTCIQGINIHDKGAKKQQTASAKHNHKKILNRIIHQISETAACTAWKSQ